MASILCFGDSNTWGTSPAGKRYNESERWTTLLTGKLAKKLSKKTLAKHLVIEAGQPNRTLVHNAPFSAEAMVEKVSGIRYLKPYLIAHQPDVILIMLGTNDLKKRFKLSASDIAQGMHQLVRQIIQFNADGHGLSAKVLIISPPPIYEVGAYINMYAGGAKKSQQLKSYYERVAQTLKCFYFDAGSVVQSCPVEGIHWQVNQHALLAEALSEQVAKLLTTAC